MTEPEEPRLVNDQEWAELMHARYRREGAMVDEVAKARVWQNLERHLARPRSRLLGAWASIAAALVLAVGVTQLWQPDSTMRHKGNELLVPAILTAYQLGGDGSTQPLLGPALVGSTVVFRAHSSQAGYYGVVLRDGQQPWRIAIAEGQSIDANEVLLNKGGNVFGLVIEPNTTNTICLVVMADRELLAVYLQTLAANPQLPAEHACVTVKASSP